MLTVELAMEAEYRYRIKGGTWARFFPGICPECYKENYPEMEE